MKPSAPSSDPTARPARGLGLHALLTGLSLAMVAPFAWMVLASLKTLPEASDPAWLPQAAQWGNYPEVFRVIPFLRFAANSLVVAGWVTLLQVFTSALAAFSFSRLDWPGRDRVFFLYLGTMMLPGIVMLIPNYEIMVRFGLMDSFLGLVLPSAFSAFGTFLLRQFMLGLPRALDEAAEMDGAGKWQIFWDVILPLSRPGLVTLAIFTFMGNYHSFFWPLRDDEDGGQLHAAGGPAVLRLGARPGHAPADGGGDDVGGAADPDLRRAPAPTDPRHPDRGGERLAAGLRLRPSTRLRPYRVSGPSGSCRAGCSAGRRRAAATGNRG